MKSVLAFFFLASPVFAQDFVCKIYGETRIVGRHNKTYTVPGEWTGVAVGEDLILSVAHPMAEGSGEADFNGKIVWFDVIKADKPRDLALYKCREPHGVKPVKLADRRPVIARIIGFAASGKKILNYPVKPNLRNARVIEGEPFLLMQGEAFQGMSGSPVLTEDGKLSGIQSAGDTGETQAANPEQIRAFLKHYPL
jgi:hypothetical protein